MDQSYQASDSQNYEALHVHEVYEQIATHFSSTRYKPWPLVERFLNELPDGSIGLDIGCGNGKYLAVNPKLFIVASDRSENLVKFAYEHGFCNAVVADGLSLPHPSGLFDFAISIAVIHHLSTLVRRVDAIGAILATLRPNSTMHEGSDGGRALLFVWALEQKGSRRGWDEGDEQDVMVPWVMIPGGSADDGKESKTFHRYYHLYRRGELEHDIIKAGGDVVDSGYERDNWWAVARRAPL